MFTCGTKSKGDHFNDTSQNIGDCVGGVHGKKMRELAVNRVDKAPTELDNSKKSEDEEGMWNQAFARSKSVRSSQGNILTNWRSMKMTRTKCSFLSWHNAH